MKKQIKALAVIMAILVAVTSFSACGNEEKKNENEKLFSESELKSIRESLPVQTTISAGMHHTVAVKPDGTVIATKSNDNDFGVCNVSGWTDIVAVSADWYQTVGLKSDGTVVATGFKKGGRCDVEGWTGIAAVSAGRDHTVGLKSNGTVVATGLNNCGQCRVTKWRDISY